MGPPGPPAVTDVYAVELPFAGDVLLSPLGFITLVVELGLPGGRFVVSATAAVENRGANPHDVVVWMNSVPPPISFAGTRSAQVTLEPGAAMSVTLGPFVAEIGLTGVLASLNGQRDSSYPEDQVWILEGTRLSNRAGATGFTALGTAVA